MTEHKGFVQVRTVVMHNTLHHVLCGDDFDLSLRLQGKMSSQTMGVWNRFVGAPIPHYIDDMIRFYMLTLISIPRYTEVCSG
jgi:hypothetical protein